MQDSSQKRKHRAMPLEVGGALRFRLEAQDRGRRSEVRDQSPSLKLRRGKVGSGQTTEDSPPSPYGLRRDKEDRKVY